MSKSEYDESICSNDMRFYLSQSDMLYVDQYDILLDVIDYTDFIQNTGRQDLSIINGRKDKHLHEHLYKHLNDVLSGNVVLAGGSVLYKEPSGHWIEIEGSSKSSFKQFLQKLCVARTGNLFQSTNAVDFVVSNITQTVTANNIIQFDDAYIDGSKIKHGVANTIKPKYRIHRSVSDALKKGKPTSYSKEVNELIDHLSNNDIDTKDRMVDVLSSIFVTDPHIVTKIGRFARFYGPSGENGKSTLIKLIEESIGFENVGAFKTHDFKEYKIASAIDSLLIVDDDEQGRRIPEESSANIKSTITANTIQVRQIRGEPFNVRPTMSVISLSNTLPKSEDKTEGFARRLDWFEISSRLIKPAEWFENLFSEESYQYLIELLATRAQSIINDKNHELHPKSKKMLETESQFKKNNMTVLSFLDAYDRSWFVNRTVRAAFNEYQSFCDDNVLDPIGQQKFSGFITQELDLEKRKILVKNTQDEGNMSLFGKTSEFDISDNPDYVERALNEAGTPDSKLRQAINNKQVLTFTERKGKEKDK